MAKRRPDQQLTQNNWDDELESDEVGQFQKADASEMKNRVIRTAKRRLRGDETDSSEGGAKPVSVFSGFSLLSNKSSTLGSDAAAAATAAKPLFSFGSGFSSQQPSAATAPFSSSSTVATSIFGAKTTTTDENKSSEFITKLKELNDAVLSCIKGHIDNGKACILTPIFKDYEKYVKELEDKNKNVTTTSPIKTNHVNNPTSTTGAPFSFTLNSNNKPATSTENPSTSTAAAVADAPTQSASVAPMFSFGKPSTTSAFGSSASTGFTFSSAIQVPKPADNGKKTDGGTNGNTEKAEDEEDEPPKVEFKPVVEEESIYSKRCKVFVKDDGDYKDRGTGTLYLKKVTDDKVQLIVRADTNLGNILLNILLTSGVPAKRLKNNVVLVCIPTPESDPKPRSVLIRVKGEDDATELLEEIQKHQK